MSMLFFAFSLNIFAGSVPLFTGFYQYQNDSHVILKKRIEDVNTLTQNGKNRLLELKNADYTCLLITGSIFECSLFTSETSEADRRAIDLQNEKLNGQFIEFNGEVTTPILTNDSEALKEYTYNQNGKFLNKSFDHFRLMITGPLQKLVFGNPTIFSFVVKNDVLLMNESIRINLTKNIRELVVVEGSFSK
jgi:hypothetical protein